jgi:3',5'-cyclic AMP phosphodiesterase CpdA
MPSRFLVFSDVHLGLGGVQPNGAVYGDIATVVRRAVDCAIGLRADRIVLLGDVVNRGFPDEYATAHAILRPLRDRLEPMVGNHELQRANLSDWRQAWNGAEIYRATTLGDLPAALLSSGIEGLPDSEWRGELSAAQLAFLDRFLDQHANSPVLVFCHHPLSNTVRVSDWPMGGLDNSPELERRLVAHRHDVVLFAGHTHAHHVLSRGRLHMIGCPALGFWPHAFLQVDVDGRDLALATHRMVAGPHDSPDARARACEPGYCERCEGQLADESARIPLS